MLILLIIVQGLFGTKMVHKQDSLVSINRQHELYTHNPHSSWLDAADLVPAPDTTLASFDAPTGGPNLRTLPCTDVVVGICVLGLKPVCSRVTIAAPVSLSQAIWLSQL